MKRHKSLIPLSHQHHDALILAQLIKKDAPIYKGLPTDLNGKREYTLNFYKNDLVHHFEAEELILFPFVSGLSAELDKLTNQLIDEHKQIAELVELIRSEVEVETNLDNLGNLISSHVRTEERKYFELVQKLLSESQLTVLQQELSNLDKKNRL